MLTMTVAEIAALLRKAQDAASVDDLREVLVALLEEHHYAAQKAVDELYD